MNTNIFDANFSITKIKVDSGKIKELAINGNDIEIGDNVNTVLYAWITDNNDEVYLNINYPPATETYDTKSIKGITFDGDIMTSEYLMTSSDDEYTKVNDTTFKIAYEGDTPTTVTFIRDSAKDFDLRNF